MLKVEMDVMHKIPYISITKCIYFCHIHEKLQEGQRETNFCKNETVQCSKDVH